MSGMLYGYISAFVAAALLGFFFKYPVPFRGYVSGVEGLRVAPQAVVFYLFLGGFVILPVIGVLAGLMATRFAGSRRSLHGWTFALAVVLNILFALAVMVADVFWGPF